MERIQVSITIEVDGASGFQEIVARLELAGMVVDRRMKTLGVVTGTIAVSRLEAIRRVEGVRDIEPSRRLNCLDTTGRGGTQRS